MGPIIRKRLKSLYLGLLSYLEIFLAINNTIEPSLELRRKQSMKKILIWTSTALIIALLLLGFLTGCQVGNGDTDTIIGSGELVTDEKDYSDFNRIQAGPSFEVNVTQSDIYSISITTDDNIIEYVVVSKLGDTLKLSLKENTSLDFTSLIAEITMPELPELYFEASTRGTIQGFSSSHDLIIDLLASSSLGMSDMAVGNIICNISASSSVFGSILADEAIFNISASSSVELNGSANDMIVDVSAASNARLAEFLVENAEVTVSASSRAWVQPSGRLDADVAAVSHLKYLGEPTLGDINVDLTSTIEQE
jgi:hypothetical protein